MSKRKTKYQKQREKETKAKRLMIGLVSGGVLLVAAALFFAFGSFGEDNSGTPVLVVDRELIDYGDVKFDTNLTFEITVTNTGDGTLKFAEAPYLQVREGC